VVVGGAGVLMGALLGGWAGWVGCPPVGGFEGRVDGTGAGCDASCVGCGLIGALTCDDVGGAAWVGAYCMRGAVSSMPEGGIEPVALCAGAPGSEVPGTVFGTLGAAGVSPAIATAGSAPAPVEEAPGRAGAVWADVPAAAGVPAPVCSTVATAVTAPMPAAPPKSVSAVLRIGPGFLCRDATHATSPSVPRPPGPRT
jgi:hypothetical protein